FSLLVAGQVEEFRVDIDTVILRFSRGIHDEKTLADPHLRRGQADALVLAHEGEHAGDEGLEALVKMFDWFGHLTESRVGVSDDGKKPKAFFDRGTTVAATGNFDYAIEMYLQGLALDPEAVEAHQTLRDISLKRKASGGKTMGMMALMKERARRFKDERDAMLS